MEPVTATDSGRVFVGISRISDRETELLRLLSPAAADTLPKFSVVRGDHVSACHGGTFVLVVGHASSGARRVNGNRRQRF